MNSDHIWLIGAGEMAYQYAKVLDELNIKYTVIGRSENSARKFEELSGHPVIRGGLAAYLNHANEVPNNAIVTVYPDMLKEITISLIEYGIKRILVEKPAGINLDEVHEIEESAKKNGSEVFVAYNRRFYSSVLEAKKIITEDGGVNSFNFEFTEWAHVIQQYNKPKIELNNWFMANSTHVIDLAFYLGGIPERISCYVNGHLDWYNKADRFAGAGITTDGSLFSYKANWSSAGRWSLEVLTKQHKLLFEPMEALKIMDRGSINIYSYKLDDSLDQKFKPGLYLQTKSFINNDTADMINIKNHFKMSKIYTVMQSNAVVFSKDNWLTYQEIDI